MPGSVLKLMPVNGFLSRKNALASFFETPITTTLDTTLRQSANILEQRNRHYSTVAVPIQAQERKVISLKLFALLLPLHLLVVKKTSPNDDSRSPSQRKRCSEPIVREHSGIPKTGRALYFGNETQHTTNSQF